mmetsp:Transcript_11394/g.28189  ORF Transcript_11394/g.28189 Transcript_11394/m.28189 type:complete len:142 (+) Transcript_11394:150-575(+)
MSFQVVHRIGEYALNYMALYAAITVCRTRFHCELFGANSVHQISSQSSVSRCLKYGDRLFVVVFRLSSLSSLAQQTSPSGWPTTCSNSVPTKFRVQRLAAQNQEQIAISRQATADAPIKRSMSTLRKLSSSCSREKSFGSM